MMENLSENCLCEFAAGPVPAVPYRLVRLAHHPANSFDLAHDPSNDPEPVEGHPERSRGTRHLRAAGRHSGMTDF